MLELTFEFIVDADPPYDHVTKRRCASHEYEVKVEAFGIVPAIARTKPILDGVAEALP